MHHHVLKMRWRMLREKVNVKDPIFPMADPLGCMHFYGTGHHGIWKLWACKWSVLEADQSTLHPSDYKVEGTDHSSIE